jgi:outer membrane immunogenic protein
MIGSSIHLLIHSRNYTGKETLGSPALLRMKDLKMVYQILICAAVLVATSVVSAFAADLPESTPLPALSPAPYDWTGFYVGPNVGYAFGNTGIVLSPSPNFLTINPSPQMFDFIGANGTSTMKPSGFNGGLQAGYKEQVGAVVFGAEAEWSYLGLKKSTTTGILLLPDGSNTISYSQSASITQMLTLRGIVGAPVGSFLPYVTGGLGVGWDRFSQTVQVPSIPGPCVCWSGQSSRPQTGWVVGAGIEYAISAGVSVKTEYLYSDLGSLKFATFGAPNGFPGLDLTHSARFTNQTVKVGLNFRL